ncbi:MAG: hypothetical protein DWQ29_12685, partial [Planctomycetota bacterium]
MAIIGLSGPADMAIRTTCDGCFMEYNVPDDRAGKAFKCKECGETVRVPRAGERSAPRATTGGAPRARAKPATSKPRSKRKTSSGGSGGLWIAIGVGAAVAVLAVVGVAGYLLWPQGENVAAQGDDATVASAEGTREAAPAGSSPEAPALTVDEEAIV